MQQTTARHQRVPRLSRFSWLMGLYAENYRHLNRLLAPADLEAGTYLSSVGDGLDLRVEILKHHRYTVEMRLTYDICDPVTGQPDPSAYLRVYRDARQAETTHCYIGSRWQDVMGFFPPPAELINHRMRMNTFLGKWLEYLAERGHGVAMLQRVDLPMPQLAAPQA